MIAYKPLFTRHALRVSGMLFFLLAVIVCAWPSTASSAFRYRATNVGTVGNVGTAFSQTPDMVGGGVLLTNKRSGYYMGRVFDGGNFDLFSGYQSDFNWGRATSTGTCAWAGPAAGVSVLKTYLTATGTNSSYVCPDQGAFQSQSSIGAAFNCVEGQALGPQLVATDASATFYYNARWSNSVPNRVLSAVTSYGVHVPSGTRVGYRYTSGSYAVVYLPGHGWGFIAASAISQKPNGKWSMTSVLEEQYDCGKFVSISFPKLGTVLGTSDFTALYHWNPTSKSMSVKCRFDDAPFADCPGRSLTTSLGEGSHRFEVASFDGSGAETSAVHSDFLIDNSPPQVTIDSPLDGATFVEEQALVSYNATDTLSGIASVICRIDIHWDCTNGSMMRFGGGAHTISVTATNGAGHSSTSTTTFTRLMPPLISINSPREGETVLSSSVALGFSTLRDPTFVECSVDGSPWSACSSPWTINDLSHGSHVVSIYASNAAGSTTTSVNFAIAEADTTPPTAPTALTKWGLGGQTAIWLAWNPSTDNVGVVGYDVFANGNFVQTSIAPFGAIQNALCGTAFNVSVIARDAAGNTASSSSVPLSTDPC